MDRRESVENIRAISVEDFARENAPVDRSPAHVSQAFDNFGADIFQLWLMGYSSIQITEFLHANEVSAKASEVERFLRLPEMRRTFGQIAVLRNIEP